MLIHPMLDIKNDYYITILIFYLFMQEHPVKKSLGQVRLHMFKNHVQVKKQDLYYHCCHLYFGCDMRC